MLVSATSSLRRKNARAERKSLSRGPQKKASAAPLRGRTIWTRWLATSLHARSCPVMHTATPAIVRRALCPLRGESTLPSVQGSVTTGAAASLKGRGDRLQHAAGPRRLRRLVPEVARC